MIDSLLLREIERIVGPEHVSARAVDTEVYGYDGSLATAVPDAVCLPANAAEAVEVMRVATAGGVPCLARGFGTNLSGGTVAPRGGLVVGMTKLNRILTVNPEGRYAVVETGVTNLELQNALAPLGFTYAPDPASQKVSTLGGNIGENSGGPHCVKYGVTSNHVLGMNVLLADGQVVRFGGTALDTPGFDLRGLTIGSEGTLGVATEIIVRILPAPESVATLLAVYDSHVDAARSVSAVIAAGIVPATLEMMDGKIINAVEDSKPSGYPRDAAAVLIIEVDGPAVGLQQQADEIREICLGNGCREVRKAKDAAERDKLWAGRRGAFGAIARLAPAFLVADCTVPRTRLPDALAEVARVADSFDIPCGNVLHAGDGNLHPVLLFDPRDEDQLDYVHKAGHEIMRACVALGGTITGEHGVGVEKSKEMRLVFSEDDLDVQRAVYKAFDPDEVLNPGKIFPPPLDKGNDNGTAEGAHNGKPDWGVDVTPVDVEQLCGVVRQAYDDGAALLPVGSGMRIDFGNYSDRKMTRVRTTGIDAITDYDPANQVVSVGAGMTLGTLQDLLAENDQWLPLRPPGGGRHTLGGIAALGLCGPERLRYGAPRDLLLGLRFVSGLGKPIAAGGRVVKNVAGYDVTRLITGSAGTLGVITELTFRILARSKCRVAVIGTGTINACSRAAAELLRSKLEPNLLAAAPLDPTLESGQSAAWRLTAGFEGFRHTVDFQIEHCRSLAAESGLADLRLEEYETCAGPCAAAFDALEQAPLLVRTDVPTDEVLAATKAAADLLPEAAAVVDFGCGRITLATNDLTGDAWTRFGSKVRELGGHAIVEKATESFARDHEVFGTPTTDWTVMHKIKDALDPHNVFAPGRMPGKK